MGTLKTLTCLGKFGVNSLKGWGRYIGTELSLHPSLTNTFFSKAQHFELLRVSGRPSAGVLMTSLRTTSGSQADNRTDQLGGCTSDVGRLSANQRKERHTRQCLPHYFVLNVLTLRVGWVKKRRGHRTEYLW